MPRYPHIVKKYYVQIVESRADEIFVISENFANYDKFVPPQMTAPYTATQQQSLFLSPLSGRC